MAIINGYQTLNPNRENNRAMLPSIVTVHWTKQPSSMMEHHAMTGSSNIKLSKGGTSGGAFASAASASASVSTAASAVTAASRGTTFTVRSKLSVY